MPYIILIAEDYVDTREFMAFIFRSYGYQVHEAANGSEALKLTNSCHPDLVLMDISMPIMDGLEATQLIRASSSGVSRTPIIAITAFDNSYKKRALAAGCNEVLSKPVDFAELDLAVQRYLPKSV